MTPRQLVQEIEHSFDARDRESMARYLGLLAATAQPPDFARLSLEQLEARRGILLGQLAEINDRLVAMHQAGRRTGALPADWPRVSMEPSDP